MYSFGPVVTLPVHQSPQTLLRSESSPDSDLEGKASVLSIPLSFQTGPFWHSAELCGISEGFWTCCCPAGHPLCPDPSQHGCEVGASRPLPRVVKHKPSSIVFSDKSEAAPHKDLIGPEDEEASSEHFGSDDKRGNVCDNCVSCELHRRFFISRRRRDTNRGKLKTKRGPSYIFQEAISSAEAKESGVSVHGEKVRFLFCYISFHCKDILLHLILFAGRDTQAKLFILFLFRCQETFNPPSHLLTHV